MSELETALEQLSTVYDVSIEFSDDDDSLDADSSPVCTSSGTTLAIEFLVSEHVWSVND